VVKREDRTQVIGKSAEAASGEFDAFETRLARIWADIEPCHSTMPCGLLHSTEEAMGPDERVASRKKDL
jgi:hypothetical protein